VCAYVFRNSNNEASRHASASRTAGEIQELREASASRLADAKAQIVALVTKLSRLDETLHDSNLIMENQRSTIKAFASDAESIVTCSFSEPTGIASLQVSTLIADSTRSASFATAWTSASQGEVISNNAVYPRQLMLGGIGRGTAAPQSSEFRNDYQLMVVVENIPLLISGLEHISETAQTFRSMRNHRPELTKICRLLRLENLAFSTTWGLIFSLYLGYRTRQAVPTQPGGQAWRETQVEQELRRFEQHFYPVILELVVDMHGALVALTGKLRLGPDVGRVRSFLMIGCVLTVQAGPAQQSEVVPTSVQALRICTEEF
jgi:hypothetical protein